MKLISREELKEKLDREDNFKLVFVLGEWNYRALHIPGSIHVDSREKAQGVLDPKDEIVVYCANESCTASIYACNIMEQNGFENVRRYAGGIQDWDTAGYPVEGEMVQS